MRGRLLLGVAAVVLVVAAYLFMTRSSAVAPHLVSSDPVAMIGSGSSAVGVAADGTVLAFLPAPEEGSLPTLPLETPPKGPRLRGPALEEARILGAAPPALRPYVEGSYYGESGIDVKLTSGVELRFGDSTQAARKWRAAAAVLADPKVTALDYVDLLSPRHPSIGGSGHTLPSIP
ncbi:MAG TPA: cell division protein FtsQ/DivIB [Solirubrobacterales bacterium]|nr:cell division protein FtsQ/DivIB [Solirubrobacterales bacterium]